MYTLGYVLKTNDQLTSLYIFSFCNVVAHSMIYALRKLQNVDVLNCCVIIEIGFRCILSYGS